MDNTIIGIIHSNRTQYIFLLANDRPYDNDHTHKLYQYVSRTFDSMRLQSCFLHRSFKRVSQFTMQSREVGMRFKSFGLVSLILIFLSFIAFSGYVCFGKNHNDFNGSSHQKNERNTPKTKLLTGVKPVESDSTFIGSIHQVLKAAGDEWSIPRLTGTFGHAFSFSMKIGDGAVWQQANIDWWLLWEMIPHIGYTFHEFQIIHHDKETAPNPTIIQKTKDQTWNRVKESIDRGIPAIAWQPMSVAYKESGVNAYGWGLLVGYDEKKKTYTVRHQHVKEEYNVPYNQFGYTDPVGWYCVMVLGEKKKYDQRKLVVRSLANAIAYANGTRYDLEDAPYKVDAVGFAAYQLWKQAVEKADVDIGFTEHSAWILWEMRENAAAFLREIYKHFPKDSSPILFNAAEIYDTEIKSIVKLINLCKENDSFTKNTRQIAVELIDAALESEKKAIKKIEQALRLISNQSN